MPVVKEEESPLAEGDHPEPRQLELFLRCQLPRIEVRDVVRHLLTGCPRCGQLIRRLWAPGERTPRDLDPQARTKRGSG